MRFERTSDISIIRSVMAHPRVYPGLHDDNAPPAEEWMPTIHDLLSYMLVIDEGNEVIGLYMVAAHSLIL